MIRALILSIQFLTRIPINVQVEFNKDTVKKTPLFYPFVGVLVGSVAAFVYSFFVKFGNDLASILSVAAIVILTGGMHLDGLSDTADGFFSSREREKILEIMKDSRIGAFGVLAIVLDILLRYTVIKNCSVATTPIIIILSCGISRTLCAMTFTFCKSAKNEGLGKLHANKESIPYFVMGLIIFLLFGFIISKNALLIRTFVVSFLASIFICLMFVVYSYRKIGGITGDVLGAICEITEIVSLILFQLLEFI